MSQAPILYERLRLRNSSDPDNSSAVSTLQYVPSPVQDYRKELFVFWLVVLQFTGLIGNSLLLHLTRHERMYRGPEGQPHDMQERRALMYYFVHSLAVSGLLTTLFDLPLVIVQGYWDFLHNDWICRGVRMVEVLFPAATFYILFVANIERYVTILHPFLILRPSTAKKLVGVAWCVAVMVSAVAASGYTVHELRIDQTHFTRLCKNDKMSFSIRLLVFCSVTVVYFIPSIIVLFTSIQLMKVIWKKIEDPNLSLELASKIRATRILILLVIIFMFPYLALLSFRIAQVLSPSNINIKDEYVIYHIFLSIGYSSVTVNPVVCFVQLKSLRNKLWSLLLIRRSQVTPLDIGVKIVSSLGHNVFSGPNVKFGATNKALSTPNHVL